MEVIVLLMWFLFAVIIFVAGIIFYGLCYGSVALYTLWRKVVGRVKGNER